MRNAFVRTLVELRRQDPRVMLLTADIGYLALEPFAEAFPRSFFNVGVAEQNMIGLSTGLAEAGFLPFAYSIAPFAALRPYEFIRNGPAHHGLPVRIVGMGGGFEYGPAGPTHHALEDVGVLRTLPGLRIVAPADHAQTVTALRATWDLPGPAYYRLGKDDRSVVPGLDGRYEDGRVQIVREGRAVLLLAMGAVAVEAAAAAEALAQDGIDAACGVCACLAPAPEDDLAALCARFPVVVTVEAHVVAGGLGSIVCEVVAGRLTGAGAGTGAPRVVRAAVRAPSVRGGSTRFHHAAHGLTREALAATARTALREARGA